MRRANVQPAAHLPVAVRVSFASPQPGMDPARCHGHRWRGPRSGGRGGAAVIDVRAVVRAPSRFGLVISKTRHGTGSSARAPRWLTTRTASALAREWKGIGYEDSPPIVPHTHTLRSRILGQGRP